ncbi:MAG: DegV family protein [Lachnospiraceae bacterium]|nr:DegV family protein [Lachnospiraceae bacterium]
MYVLSCCSTADLDLEYMRESGLSFIGFHYTLDGVTYTDDLEQTMTYAEFYQRLTSGSDCVSSQINSAEYEEYFRKFLQEGQDILHVTLSSGISGTLNSARVAAEELMEEFPGRTVYIVDSLCASSGLGLFMATLSSLKAGGMSLEELYQWALDNRQRLRHYFFSSDLSFFIKGGRISKAAGVFGGMLGICPLMDVAPDGTLRVLEKIRGKKRVTDAIVRKMEQTADKGREYDGKCFISNSACLKDAEAVAKLVEERFPKLDGKVKIFSIGTTIGTHTGPGTVALFFWGSPRGG